MIAAVIAVTVAEGRQTSLASGMVADTPELGTAEMHLGKGQNALDQGRYEEAVNEFRAALRLDPRLVLRARYPLAAALLKLNRSAEARQELEAVRRELGDRPDVLYDLGRLDLLDQNFGGAIEKLSKAMAKPPFPDTAYYLGFAYLKQGSLAAAEKWLKVAANANPRDQVISYQLGLVYRKEGREEEAKKAFARSSELRQDEIRDWQINLTCRQKVEQGLTQETRAVCLGLHLPGDAAILSDLGLAYGKQGNFEAAVDPLRLAAALAPQQPRMQYNLAFTYYQLSRFEEARSLLADAVQRWPDVFLLNALYGAVLSKLGEDVQAYHVLRHAQELNPQDTDVADLLFETTVGLARKSLSAQRYSESLNYFEEAANLRPNDPEPHRGKAEIYDLTGRRPEAILERQQADRLNSVR